MGTQDVERANRSVIEELTAIRARGKPLGGAAGQPLALRCWGLDYPYLPERHGVGDRLLPVPEDCAAQARIRALYGFSL